MPARVRDGVATMDEVERWYAERVVEKEGGNLSKAARVLGVDRGTLARWRR